MSIGARARPYDIQRGVYNVPHARKSGVGNAHTPRTSIEDEKAKRKLALAIHIDAHGADIPAIARDMNAYGQKK